MSHSLPKAGSAVAPPDTNMEDSPSNVPGAPGVIQTAASLATSQEEDASTDDDVEDLIRPAAATIFSEAPPGPLPEDEVSREDENLLKYFIMLQPKGPTATTLAKVCTVLYSGGGQSFKDYCSYVLGFSNTKYRKIFTLHERNTLEAGTDWQTFDITFLYKLLQWVCGLAPPSDKKWTEPMASGVDEELEYMLYRIKCERNFLAHVGVTLSDKELQERSSKLKTLLENILCKVGQQKNIDLSQDVKTARIKLDEILNSVVLGNPGGAPTWPVSSSGQPVMILNPNQPGLIQDDLIGKVQQPGIPNVDISTSLPSIQQQQPMPGPSVPGVQTPAQGMNMTNQRTVVWQGTLEWQEKKYDNNSRVVHQVTCKMMSLNVNGEPEVKAEGWAPTLIMQMIPKNILGSIDNMFFKNTKTVTFMPDQSPALDVLTAFLIKGLAGCVHVIHTGTTQQSDVKVIILLFSGENKAYVGFIPVDQLSFINNFKTIIQAAKRGQQPNAMMPIATGANVTQPVQSLPGMMIVPTNPNMQPIQTNAGNGMNIMSTQPQSMIIQQNPQLTQALNQPLNQGIGGGQQMPPLTVMQGMDQPGQGNVNVPLGNPGQNVLQPRTPLGMQQQQTDQEKMQILQIRQSQQHTQAIRQQLQQQLQHKPGITNVSMNIGQQGTGANTCPTMGQPRMLQPSIQNPGLQQLLQQQVRLQQQEQQVQHQQQQQHPQQQQILMMQQQGIRPQLTQQGQQVLGQPVNQQNMGQPTIGQQNLGQQAMNLQGIGQSIQDSTDYMVDLL